MQSFLKHFLTAISTALFVIQTRKCIEIFLQNDSVTTSKMHGTDNAEFPSLSICPDYHEAYNPKVLEKFNTSSHQMRDLKYPNTSFGSLHFFELSTYNLTEILKQMTIQFRQFENKLIYTKESIDEREWKQQNWPTLGRCFTYDLPMKLRKLDVRYIEVKVAFDVLIYFHHPGQFWWVDSVTKLPVTHVKTGFVDITHSVVHSLPKESQNGTKTCSVEVDFDYDNCYKKAFQDQFFKNFGCLHPLFLAINQTENVCNLGQMTETKAEEFQLLHKSKHNSLDSLNSLNQIEFP